MAERASLIVNKAKGVYTIVWTSVGTTSADDSGAGVIIPGGYEDVTIHVKGTFAGSTLTVQGSNDAVPSVGAAWAALNADPSGAAAFTVAGVKKLAERAFAIRPVLTCGSSSNLDVTAIIRKK